MNNLQLLERKLSRTIAKKHRAIELNKTFKLVSLNQEIAQLQTQIEQQSKQWKYSP